jgi:predicted ArsR family transcriptional regulator
VSRSLAAFHLDRLAAEGLLEVTHRRLAERRGPGAGRPAKLYRRAAATHAVSLPPRQYELVARLLAGVVEELGADLVAQSAADALGQRLGREAAGRGEDAAGALAACGFEPYAAGGELRARNCPFHALAAERPALMCGLGGALVEGVLHGLGDTEHEVRLDPLPGECCVVVRSKTNRD